MSQKAVIPTNPETERATGRLALWLDPEDVQWLSHHCCCLPDAPKDVTDRCSRIRFRAGAALHRAGLKEDDENARHEP
jgi:hypothetical protein